MPFKEAMIGSFEMKFRCNIVQLAFLVVRRMRCHLGRNFSFSSFVFRKLVSNLMQW